MKDNEGNRYGSNIKLRKNTLMTSNVVYVALRKKYVLDWPTVSYTWPVWMGINLSREEVLALEDAGF